MTINNQSAKILFISTYPPQKCGIASFTQDLVTAIAMETHESNLTAICALDNESTENIYDSTVSMVMDSYELESCIETAAKINSDHSIGMVCIEHEFGLFGGELGEYLLGFLALLEKPFVIRFHTVLPSPSLERLKIVKTLSALAERVIVMTKNSARLLQEDYQISPPKISIIPHGTHTGSDISANELKIKYNLKDNLVLTTFGLLSPNKGIENGILAMKDISGHFPNAMYIVLGRTHPNLVKQEGEKYRDYLQQIVDDNNLQDNVRLVNEYVPTKKLMEYLRLTDIYFFTAKDPNQAVSGTFLYAMSAGCCIISNSFVLAKEMLDDETGVIVEAGNEKKLAESAIRLFQNRHLIDKLGQNAFLKTRNTTWERVAGKHERLFNEILGKPAFTPSMKTPLTY